MAAPLLDSATRSSAKYVSTSQSTPYVMAAKRQLEVLNEGRGSCARAGCAEMSAVAMSEGVDKDTSGMSREIDSRGCGWRVGIVG